MHSLHKPTRRFSSCQHIRSTNCSSPIDKTERTSTTPSASRFFSAPKGNIARRVLNGPFDVADISVKTLLVQKVLQFLKKQRMDQWTCRVSTGTNKEDENCSEAIYISINEKKHQIILCKNLIDMEYDLATAILENRLNSLTWELLFFSGMEASKKVQNSTLPLLLTANFWIFY